MTRSIYRRLTAKRRAFLAYTQLFVGPDHLLLVRSNRFEERYQRFFFKDIQALVVTGVPSRTWLQASLGVLAGAITLLALTTIRIAAWRVLAGMVGVIPAVIALIDYFRGERCGMIVKTAASNEPLPPVSRMSTARLVIARLKPAIEQMQRGEWTSEMRPASGPPVMAPRPLKLPPANRLLPALFGLVSVDALIYLIARLTHRDELLFVLINMITAEIVLSIAVIRRRGDDPRWLLFALAGAIAVCAFVDILSGMGLFGFFGYVSSEDQRTGAKNATRFMQLSWTQSVMWWGMGWRAAIATLAWIQFFLSPRPKADPPPDSLGGAPSLL
jgi:hypothetical protein